MNVCLADILQKACGQDYMHFDPNKIPWSDVIPVYVQNA